MKLFSIIRSWFFPSKQSDAEMRIMQLEQDVHHLKGLLNTDSISLAGMTKHEEHFDLIVSKSVMKWLGNWADDKYVSEDDIEDAVSNAIDNNNLVDDACDSWLNNQDWDYNLRDSIDWDRVADKVAEKLDWETIISDNDIVTTNDIDVDDVMLKSDHMSEDDLVTRADLSDMVIGELKRDWFEQKLKEDVQSIFKSTLQAARENEEANCRNAIDDEIMSKVDTLVSEELQKKFGESFDIWFHNLIAHAVKSVISEMITAAHDQVVANSEDKKNA